MNSDVLSARLDAVARRLADARRVLFITGAGISADSGLPTYRGVGGIYNGAATEEGWSIEEVLSGDMFAARPDLTWKYLLQIADSCHGAQPNAAHRAIAALESRCERVLVFTQNVDGLHRDAGSRDLIEIHGNLREIVCTVCDHEQTAETLPRDELPPRCPACGGVLRPRVVLFGEALPEEAMDRFLDAFAEGFDLVFTIGTSSHFPYIAQPVVFAAANGIATVEINPARTPLSGVVDAWLPLGAAAAMQGIADRLS